MKIIYFENEFFPVIDCWENNKTVFLQIGEGLAYEVTKTLASNFGTSAHATEFDYYVRNATITKSVIGCKFDHINWENIIENNTYAETREVYELSFLEETPETHDRISLFGEDYSFIH